MTQIVVTVVTVLAVLFSLAASCSRAPSISRYMLEKPIWSSPATAPGLNSKSPELHSSAA